MPLAFLQEIMDSNTTKGKYIQKSFTSSDVLLIKNWSMHILEDHLYLKALFYDLK
jgi:hypothetical protein